MMRLQITILVCSFLFSLSCSEKKQFGNKVPDKVSGTEKYSASKLEYKEFLRWCSEEGNGISKTNEIGDLKYELMYMPPEGMAFLELQGNIDDNTQVKKSMEHYADLVYFKLSIEWIGGNRELLKYNLLSPQQYEWRVKYASYDLQNDLFAVQNGDTIYPALYHFERVFEAAPRMSVMFAFDHLKLDKRKAFTVTFNDNLLDKGCVNYNYKDEQLINVPEIIGF